MTRRNLVLLLFCATGGIGLCIVARQTYHKLSPPPPRTTTQGLPYPQHKFAGESEADIYHSLDLPAPDDVVAVADGERIPARDLYRLLMQGYGLKTIAQQIQDRLVQQEAAKRGVVVTESEIESKIATLRQELKSDPSSKATLDSLLSERKMTLQQFKRELADQIALERMVRHDLRLPNSTAVRDDQLDKWVSEVRRRANIRGSAHGLRPGLAALVNDEAIYEAEIIKEITDRLPRAELDKMLNRLIDDALVAKLMTQRQINIRAGDLDALTKNLERELQKKPGMAGVTLDNYLQATGRTLNDLRDQFRLELGLRKVVAQEITEEQLRLAFSEYQDAYTGKTVHARHILAAAVDLQSLKPKDAHAFDRALAKIQNLQHRLQSGGNFAGIAIKESDDPGTASKGGDLGFIRRLGDVAEEIARIAFLLKKDEISPPVRSPYGYHLVHVLEIRPGRAVRFEDVKQAVLADAAIGTCSRWLQSHRQKVPITINLGRLGRLDTEVPSPGARPRT